MQEKLKKTSSKMACFHKFYTSSIGVSYSRVLSKATKVKVALLMLHHATKSWVFTKPNRACWIFSASAFAIGAPSRWPSLSR